MHRLFLIPILSLFILFVVAIPLAHVAYAYTTQTEVTGETSYEDAYVPCGTKDVEPAGSTQKVLGPGGVEKTIPGDGIVDNPCKFTDIIVLAKKFIMGWIIAGVIIATMGFAYAGLLYITSMGSTEKISHAHSICVKTFWGFVFMLSAWLIAYTMESIFLSDEARLNSFLKE